MANAPVPQIWTVAALLQWTTDFFAKKAVDAPRLSAELLLAHTLDCSRMALYTQYDRVPSDTQLTAFRAAVKQRAEHVPVAYLVGRAWFFSLEFHVTRDVLIPRPDTETLVEQVIQRVRQTPGWEAPAILDLCTGTGCIAIALAKNLPTAQFVATDVSDKALAVVKENAELHKVSDRIRLLQGDLWEAVAQLQPPQRFQVVVSNPPYIPTGEIPKLEPAVRDHEPRLALDGGADGLDFHRRIVAGADNILEPGGLLALEIAFDQGPAAEAALAAAGYLENIRVLRDAAGQQRCVLANKVKGAG